MPEQTETEWATIGKVIALFGLRGELKVRLLTDIPNRFAQLDVVYIGPEHLRFLIKSVRPYKGDLILLGLEGLNDANTAETVRNLDICIPLSQLATLPPDSYYQHDIIGPILGPLRFPCQPVGEGDKRNGDDGVSIT